MRITPKEQEMIRQTVAEADPSAVIYLFGSRTDDSMRGGDIDLLLESRRLDSRKVRDLHDRLFHRLGEQKVDLFVTTDYSEPFARIAKRKGVRL